MQDGRIPVRSTPPIEQKALTPQDPGHITPNGNGGGAKSPILQGEDERHIRGHPGHQTPKEQMAVIAPTGVAAINAGGIIF